MIDPVCAIHGKRSSEHACLYCCLCFKSLTPDECSFKPNGDRVDVCIPCAEEEQEFVVAELHRLKAEVRNCPSIPSHPTRR